MKVLLTVLFVVGRIHYSRSVFMQVRTIYVLWALLFLCPITALAQESALTGGSEEPQKEAPAADKNSTVDSNKKQGEKSDD